MSRFYYRHLNLRGAIVDALENNSLVNIAKLEIDMKATIGLEKFVFHNDLDWLSRVEMCGAFPVL